jgi:hypothetical protein
MDLEKLLIESNDKSLVSPMKGDLNLGWDYCYYNPDNNPFSKNWLTLPLEKTTLLLVTEVNRAMECVCGKRIGDVSVLLRNKKRYCASCGHKHLVSEEQKQLDCQQDEAIAAT